MSITKGPWSGPVNNASRFEIQGDGRRIAVVDRIEDARLMLAAPELLSHLKFAVKVLSGIPAIGGSAQVDAMRAAIAKAEQS